MKQNLEIQRLEELVADLRQDKMLRDMTIILVSHMDEVIEQALLPA